MGSSTKHILIVDDEEAIAETLQFILQEEGYHVSTSNDGDELEGSLRNGSRPDLVILDYWLPRRNGDEIAKSLKNNQHTAHIPIIMISASNNISEIAKAAGVDDFIPKPFDFDEILSKVKKHLN